MPTSPETTVEAAQRRSPPALIAAAAGPRAVMRIATALVIPEAIWTR
jgi:hypothetical protein